jgi:hypothetical protein
MFFKNKKGTMEMSEEDKKIFQLEKLDDEYMALEKEFQAEAFKLKQEYTDKQKPLLEKRTEFLASEGILIRYYD